MTAGCGGFGPYSANNGNSLLAISASARSITTNGEVRFLARTLAGDSSPVTWEVRAGGNDGRLGQGYIDATGLYMPPSAISRDAVDVTIAAMSQADSSVVATQVLTVTPGFLQPLTPETATLAPGASMRITGQIAEVGGGSVRWALRPDRAPDPDTVELNGIDDSVRRGVYGSLAQQECQLSPQNYTLCSVLYTAPPGAPFEDISIYLMATVAPSQQGSQSLEVSADGLASATAPVSIRLNREGIDSTPLTNQAAQLGPIQLGSSGGNNGDYDSDGQGNVLECCGGTLGALVASPGGSQYILSNNHVLAESDQAEASDTVLQPGLIDSGCAAHPRRGAGRPVGALKYYVPLSSPQSNVDAALAAVNPGAVDSSGAILQLGWPAANSLPVGGAAVPAAPPAAGTGEAINPSSFAGSLPLQVAKSGRTTGLTCTTIDAIDLSVEVDYFKDCAETQPYYTKTYSGQIGLPGNSFADSGDSGALIVDSRNAEPVGLLFATGSDGAGAGYSVANPIRDVLGELGAQAGQQLSIVGGGQHPVACLNYDQNTQNTQNASLRQAVPPAAMRQAAQTASTAGAALVNRAAGILGAAAGASIDSPGDPAVILYVDKDRKSAGASLPQTLNGIRTLIIPADAASVSNSTAPVTLLTAAGIHVPAGVLEAAADVQRKYSKDLMADPAIFGVGVTQSFDDPTQAALLVLVDAHRIPVSAPATIGGLRVRYVHLDRFHVTKSKFATAPRPASCRPNLDGSKPWEPPSAKASRIPFLSLP